ncbi:MULTISPECIES: hypothetical protein [unclassified Chryseobacterium]|uniref:hypothetical protein n=1 Tax=unclassified Chryseobacterium TaxID=2593645 RepID=UPI00285373A2|nr:hypothetical protein [Chryseobacterium sp. CFS7]MDR4894330.1 hypothetical protein [Chryseobacterium sp. CFS7]
MPQTETEELHERPEKAKNNRSHTQQTDKHESTDFKNKNAETDTSPVEKPKKGKANFLHSIMANGSSIKGTLKTTAIGLAAGFALGMLFPPLGLAVMAISAIAGVIAIGVKVKQIYNKTKAYNRTRPENSYNEEHTEAKSEILREIVRELVKEKLSQDKEESKQQDKKNGVEEDFQHNMETLAGSTRKKAEHIPENGIKKGVDNDPKLSFNSRTKNAGTDHNRKPSTPMNESRMAMFTQPLNSPHPNIKRGNTASKPKAQRETQSVHKNMGMRRNTL